MGLPKPDFHSLMGGINRPWSPLPECSGQMDPAGSPPPPTKSPWPQPTPSLVKLVAGSQPCSLGSLVEGKFPAGPWPWGSPQGNTHCHHCHHGNPPSQREAERDFSLVSLPGSRSGRQHFPAAAPGCRPGPPEGAWFAQPPRLAHTGSMTLCPACLWGTWKGHSFPRGHFPPARHDAGRVGLQRQPCHLELTQFRSQAAAQGPARGCGADKPIPAPRLLFLLTLSWCMGQPPAAPRPWPGGMVLD